MVLIIGILVGYDVGKVLNLGVQIAAIMVLQPKMISVYMEGLTPVSDAANDFIKKHFPGHELYIGIKQFHLAAFSQFCLRFV